MAALGGAPPAYIDADPRLPHHDYPIVMLRKLHDPNVTFEEYLHYASITRAEPTDVVAQNQGNELGLLKRFKKKNIVGATIAAASAPDAVTPKENASDENIDEEKKQLAEPSGGASRAVVTTDEWEQASRAARTASWGAVFCKS